MSRGRPRIRPKKETEFSVWLGGLGLTQGQLAEVLHVDASTVSRWLSGQQTPEQEFAVRFTLEHRHCNDSDPSRRSDPFHLPDMADIYRKDLPIVLSLVRALLTLKRNDPDIFRQMETLIVSLAKRYQQQEEAR